MLTIRYRNKINLIKKFLLLWGGFGIGTMLAMVSLLYRLFIRIFDHSPNIQPCRVFSAMAKRSPWLPHPLHSLSFAACRMFLYMWASGAHQTHCLTVHRHREQFIRWCWNAVCMMGKINTMTKLLCICCVKHETFFRMGQNMVLYQMV